MKTLKFFLMTLILSAGFFKASAQQCNAGFGIDTTNEVFQFTPNGLWYASYHWDFGDGDTSDVMDVTHTYASVGNYNVCLTVIDSGATCTNTVCQTITVSPCQLATNLINVSFTYVNTQFSVGFTNTSSSPNPPFTYNWQFGNGTPPNSSAANPVVTFPTGQQYANLIAVDAMGCHGTYGTYLNVIGNLPCNAQITANHETLGTYSFADSIALLSTGYTYNWTFGDGNVSTASTPTHTYAVNGNYPVCLIVSNAGAGCADTSCTLLQVNACGTFASFTDINSGLTGNTLSYTSTSTTLNPPLTYSWSFPGAVPATSTSANPVVVYTGNGSATAKLTVTDAGGCVDSASGGVIFGTQAPYYLNGAVLNASCSTVAYLILEDTVGHLTLIDTLLTADSAGNCSGGQFSFAITVPGTYFLKVALEPGNPDYDSYLPTYYGDTLSWVNATPLYINQVYNNYPQNFAAWIYLIQGVNTGGPGFIGGWVSEGAGLDVHQQGANDEKSLGDPIAGVQIDLTTADGQAVAYTFTDANGHYMFSGLAYGAYTVFADQLNKIPAFINATISGSQPGDTSVNMSINSRTAVATGISTLNNISIDRVYPNPVVYNVSLDVSSDNETSATLKLVDVLGRTELEKQVKLINGENHFEINADEIAAGVYQLILQTEAKRIAYKLVKAN